MNTNTQSNDCFKKITTIKKSGNDIHFIYHLSDIHIRPRERHSEYLQVFEKTYFSIKNDIVSKKISNNNCLIVLTGDIVHNKTEMSPELISMVSNFFINLCKISDVIVLPGNHDCNLSNLQRMDSLTPIVQCLSEGSNAQKNINLFYLKYSGYYFYNNIVFGVSSVVDNIFLPSPDKELLESFGITNNYNIALYHGAVHGSVTDVGYRMNKTDLTVDNFKGYDYALLGDIHKYQYVDRYMRMAYPGSLIQQSFGEQPDGHGILRWNLKTGLSTLMPIKNDYGYFKLHIKKGILLPVSLAQNSTILCTLEDTTPTQYMEIINKLKKIYNICEIKPQNLDIKQKYDKIEASQSSNIENSFNIIEKYARKIKLTSDQIKNITDFHKEIYKTTCNVKDNNITVKQDKWEIIELKFSNTLSYGKNNIINFSKYEKNKIIGIFGPNHYGKSAILDIILFCLFDKCSRGERKDILNKNKNWMHCSLLLNIGNVNYFIERRGIRNKNGLSVKIDVEFFKITNVDGKEIMENLTGIDKNDTNRRICNIVGDYNDYIATCICLQRQGKTSTFTDMTNLQKKEYLYEILKLNVYDSCYQTAHKKLAEISSVLKLLENQFKNVDVETIISTIKSLKKEIKFLQYKNTLLNNLADYVNYIVNNTIVSDLICYDSLKDFNLATVESINCEIVCLDKEIKKCNVPDNKDIVNIYQSYIDQLKILKNENCFRLKKLIIDKQDNTELMIELENNLKNKVDVQPNWLVKVDTVNENKVVIQNKINNINKVLSENLNIVDKIDVINTIKEKITQLYNNKKFILEKYKNNTFDQIITKYKDLDNESLFLNKSIYEVMVKILNNKQLNNISLQQLKDDIKIDTGFKYHVDKNILLIEKLKTTKTAIQLKNHNNKWLIRLQKKKNLIANYTDNAIDLLANLTKKKNMCEINKIELLETIENIKYNNNIQLKVEYNEKKLEVLSQFNSKKQEIDCLKKEKALLLNELSYINDKLVNYEKYITNSNINQIIDNKIKKIKLTIQINLENDKIFENKSSELQNQIDKLSCKISKYDILVENKNKLIANKKLLTIYQYMHIKWQLSKSIQNKWMEKKRSLFENTNEILSLISQKTFELDLSKNKLNQYLKQRKEYDQVSLQLQTCQLYCQIVDRDGLPYEILKQYLPVIEQDINQTLNSMVKFNVEFTYARNIDNDTNKPTKSSLGAININITRDKFKSYNVHLASGFELFIINLAIRMTLCRISLNSKPNFLIIDEGWACFDSDNLGNINLIMAYIKQQYDHIIIISHLDSLKHQSDYIVNIDKKGDFSFVKTSTTKLGRHSKT